MHRRLHETRGDGQSDEGIVITKKNASRRFVQVKDSISGDILFGAIPMRMERLQSFKLAMHLLIAERLKLAEHWVRLIWKFHGDATVQCEYVISLPDEPLDRYDRCMLCERLCDDVDCWPPNGRELNCVRCQACSLCDLCKVRLNVPSVRLDATWVCLLCLSPWEVEIQQPEVRKRMIMLEPWWEIAKVGLPRTRFSKQ